MGVSVFGFRFSGSRFRVSGFGLGADEKEVKTVPLFADVALPAVRGYLPSGLENEEDARGPPNVHQDARLVSSEGPSMSSGALSEMRDGASVSRSEIRGLGGGLGQGGEASKQASKQARKEKKKTLTPASTPARKVTRKSRQEGRRECRKQGKQDGARMPGRKDRMQEANTGGEKKDLIIADVRTLHAEAHAREGDQRDHLQGV